MGQGIAIVRGTTNAFGVTVKDSGGNVVTLDEGQVLVFGIKKNPKDAERLLVKKLSGSDGEYVLELTPADTKDIEPGKYFYDVGLQQGESIFYNVIESSLLEIKPNITELGDGS